MLLYGQKAVCFMDGMLYRQKAVCFMDNNSNVQARKLDIAKIRLLYGRDCFMDKKGFALWTGLLYGQKVVCFMDGIVLLTKRGDAL